MRVLIADDQVWLRSALRLLLEHEANIEVVGEAVTLGTLPGLVAEFHPDLLFLDWQLPGLDTNGARRQLTSKLRATQPQLCIIAVTGDEKTPNCLLFGADAYVNRAESPDHILAAVRQTVSTQQ